MTHDLLMHSLHALKLTSFVDHCVALAEKTEQSRESPLAFLSALVNLELEKRHQKRIDRLIKNAQMPRRKSLKDFQAERIAGLTQTTLDRLAQGSFMDQCENVLVFGNPGTGKTHLALGLAEAWCLLGRKVLFVTAAHLIQSLLNAKAEMRLGAYLKHMDHVDMLIIDDISYTACTRDETDVLFTLLSERYEMRSLMITSNLAFSGWEQIFRDKMTTTAVIDKLVHHATILELNAESFRVHDATHRLLQEGGLNP